MRTTQLARRLLRALLLVALLVGVAIPHAIPAGAQEPDLLSAEEAASVARHHVLRESGTIPEWEGARLDGPRPHYDLDGGVAAYVFSVLKKGEDVGYVTVSSEPLPNPVLEFSTAPARHKSTRGAIHSVAARAGLPVDERKPLYLGPLAYFYPIDGDGPRRLIEMATQRIVTPGSDPRPSLPTPPGSSPPGADPLSPPSALTDPLPETAAERTTTYKLLYGPDYGWYRGCAPTAVANAMGHWADRGYPNLVYGGSDGDYQGTIDQLAELMGTSPEGWTWLPINDDVRNFAAQRGYTFRSDETFMPSYGRFVDEIDAHRPIVVLVNDHDVYNNHFITGFGYEYDPTDPDFRYMIVHDTWGSTPENYWVQYGVGYSRIWFDTVVPPQVWVDTTPPSSAVVPLASYQIEEAFDVRWSGSDEGWGLKWYDVQVRDGLAGDWTDWIVQTTETRATFFGTRGHTYTFRSRAMDIDHNQEPYPGADGDTHTTVARYVASGTVRGNRELPVMAAEVSASPPGLGPASTDAYGFYQLGLAASGTYSVSVTGGAAFGSLPPMEGIEVTGDVDHLDLILPPAVELITNGGFESGFDGWSTGGMVSPTLATTGHTGARSVLLGDDPVSGGRSVISQTVSISAPLEAPTLSFIFRIGSADPASDRFIVGLRSSTTTVTHTLPLTGGGWQHAWYDLSELAGEAAQISLEVDQDSAASPTTVFVDEVSVGPASEGPRRVYLPLIVKGYPTE